jgi:hypothetical protein
MAISNVTNQYSIPRGRVYFDLFDSAGNKTGERELGNSPGFSIEIATEKAEHYSSETGLRQKDASVVLQVDRTATLQIDNMSLENTALFFSGTASTITQSIDAAASETLTVKTDRSYQLGVTESMPVGVRNISNVVVDNGEGTTYVLGDDYEVDTDMGRIRIIPGGDIADDDEITVAYEVPAATWEEAKTGATSEVNGAFRVISDNATGVQRDFYMPRVSLQPSGSLPIIAEGTDWAVMEFVLDVLTPANGAALYLDGRPAA